jgi:hypothetical protein
MIREPQPLVTGSGGIASADFANNGIVTPKKRIFNSLLGVNQITKNQNTFAKRQREMEKKRKAEEKRQRRNERKAAESDPSATSSDAIDGLSSTPVSQPNAESA